MNAQHVAATCDSKQLADRLKKRAYELGCELVGIAPAVTPQGVSALAEWLDKQLEGAMRYMRRRRAAYEHPRHVLRGVRSVVMVGVNYRSDDPVPTSPNTARVSRYAWGSADYHDVLKQILRKLGELLHQHRPGCRTRPVVDTAPLLERDFAQRAGLGWFGKNTMLINKRLGSWFFLGALLTDVELEPDEPHQTAHCGTCTRCLEACPTDAFIEPYVLDARKCISYLTIELRDQPIPSTLREAVGEWAFGCDICQDVCPWNRKAPRSEHPAFRPSDDLNPADVLAWLQMTPEDFRRRFGHTPLSRPGRAALLRNAAIVLGNRGDEEAVPVLVQALDDVEPLVRGASAWALGCIGGDVARAALQRRLDCETDPLVAKELQAALQRIAGRCRPVSSASRPGARSGFGHADRIADP